MQNNSTTILKSRTHWTQDATSVSVRRDAWKLHDIILIYAERFSVAASA